MSMDAEDAMYMVPRAELLDAASGWRRIPAKCAHGFRVLEPGTTMMYLTCGEFVPDAEREFTPFGR